MKPMEQLTDTQEEVLGFILTIFADNYDAGLRLFSDSEFFTGVLAKTVIKSIMRSAVHEYLHQASVHPALFNSTQGLQKSFLIRTLLKIVEKRIPFYRRKNKYPNQKSVPKAPHESETYLALEYMKQWCLTQIKLIS